MLSSISPVSPARFRPLVSEQFPAARGRTSVAEVRQPANVAAPAAAAASQAPDPQATPPLTATGTAAAAVVQPSPTAEQTGRPRRATTATEQNPFSADPGTDGESASRESAAREPAAEPTVAAERRGAEGEGEGEPEDEQQEQAPAGPRGQDGESLSRDEVRHLRQLQQRDAEVRRHEQAHVAAGGVYVSSGASFQYTQGPDGRRYATGGEVSIDSSSAGTPEQTIRKMQQVRRAALAPAQPSGQDRRVAARAQRRQLNAQRLLRQQQIQERAEMRERFQGEDAAATGPDGATETGPSRSAGPLTRIRQHQARQGYGNAAAAPAAASANGTPAGATTAASTVLSALA
jgi:hypothetical protein